MRIKNGTIIKRKHKKIIKKAKGYRGRRKSVYRLAKEAVSKAGIHAYRHRREKKRVFRQLWIARLNAAVKNLGYNYSTFVAGMKKQKIKLNRKILSNLASEKPEVFKKIVKKTME